MIVNRWVFGYGSLVWKTNFPYEEKVVGHIKGFQRRFWQQSEDHRGTPEKPGRVVTVIQSDNPEDEVWGVAYKIAEKDVDSTFSYLNFREKNGYTLHTVTFYPESDDVEPFDVPLYIGFPENNPHYVGPAPVEDMAHQILTSNGPSGTNTEYLFRLAQFMKDHVPYVKDSHLFELEHAVRRLMLNSTSQG